nr:EOG090X03SL [Simocephalus serrulatus]
MNWRRFCSLFSLLVLALNLYFIETLGTSSEGINNKSANTSHLETTKFEKSNLISTTPSVAHNDTSKHPSLELALPGKGSAEEEHHNSLSIFLVLVLLGICILLIHVMLKFHFHYVPESVAVIFIGALVGLFLKLMSYQNVADWAKEEAFSPTIFFLVLLPPIIFESGYNLHKGNFFQNIGSITVFAVFGTLISAMIVGSGVYLLGLADIAYKLSFIESFAFGSLISAVDPVATLAIFQALDVDPVLNMLVFGESILNDAVAIVLTTTILEIDSPELNSMSGGQLVLHGVGRFCLMFFASAAIGMFIMWFSGLRGAIAYALSLHLEFEMETRRVLVTTTLIIVLFTILFLGGSTMPLLKCLQSKNPGRNRLRKSCATGAGVSLSKTLKLDQPLESDILSEMTEDEIEGSLIQQQEALSGFIRFDLQYLFPLFTHKFSRNEVRECRVQMSNLASQWQQAVRSSPGVASSSLNQHSATVQPDTVEHNSE